jgi:hypothetical protein
MNKEDFKVLGKEFKEMIKDILSSGDPQEISRNVGSTVNSTLDMAFEEVRKAIASIQMESRRSPGARKTRSNDDFYKQSVKKQSIKHKPTKLDTNFPYKYV